MLGENVGGQKDKTSPGISQTFFRAQFGRYATDD